MQSVPTYKQSVPDAFPYTPAPEICNLTYPSCVCTFPLPLPVPSVWKLSLYHYSICWTWLLWFTYSVADSSKVRTVRNVEFSDTFSCGRAPAAPERERKNLAWVSSQICRMWIALGLETANWLRVFFKPHPRTSLVVPIASRMYERLWTVYKHQVKV